MIINHNMNAMNAHRNMGMNTVNSGKSMEKLSSGLRINRAGDDAAGLAISEKMRGQIRGLDQAARNSQDGISLIQTAEGALNETHSILQRMRELANQAANDTNTKTDRSEVQKEINQLTSEINRIGNTTEFNTQKLLDGNKTGDAVSEVVAGADVAEKLGEMTTAVDVTGNVVINGTKFTFKTGADGNNGAEFADMASLAVAIGKNVATKDIYTATDATGGKLKLVQKATTGSDVLAKITDTTGDLTVAFDTNKVGAKAIKKGDVITEGTDGKATLQIGANKDQSFTVEIADMRSKALGISGNAVGDATNGAKFAVAGDTDALTDISKKGVVEYALDVTDNTKASAAVKVLDKAIEKVSSERSKLGAYQNRLEHTINNLGTSSENLSAAESRVRDVDMAKEMMSFGKNNILAQAAQAMLAQANQQPQGVLQLLR
ncbi:flagellin [Clostridium frigidicarnis]|uniref:Flagellin n=1 Tax=Clostridium frigidicarnis TaxID=84698 RepID=A0A1I1AP26_9CLOT|nr:flagellin [Clostridium frigidicarnis]SFB39771.1 flagellin [Clostridium frigidicarnis]